MSTVIQYVLPTNWAIYDKDKIQDELLNAKANILALKSIPFQRRWVKELQEVQLKLEVGGSSQIEGADFAANELDAAVRAETAEESFTRSQKQAYALTGVYKWLATVPDDRPITVELICDIHRRIVTNCDDDHCPPGQLRGGDHQVVFGVPVHRGATGGDECRAALEQLTHEMQTSIKGEDPLIQALALHYHFAAMHPFLDGNGRTARALEVLALQRAGLRDSLFIAMSNYYYDEKRNYLTALAEVRKHNHNLTPFLQFALKGIASQTARLANLLKRAVEKEIFRNLMHELFARLESARKRVIVKRQLMLLEKLLEVGGDIEFYQDFVNSVRQHYTSRRNPMMAIIRDMNRLINLKAVQVKNIPTTEPGKIRTLVSVNMDWPTTITETEFFAKLATLPKSKTSSYLISGTGT